MPPDLHRKETKLEALQFFGYLLGLSEADRYALDDHDREMLRRAANFLARVADRPDLIPAGGPSRVRPTYTCPRCGAVSRNPSDIEHRYCVACHVFEGDEVPDHG